MRTFGYAVLGFFFGLVLVVIGTILALYQAGTPLSLQNAIQIQLITPLLWLIDINALILAATFGFLGSRDSQMIKMQHEGLDSQRRAAELRQLNTELAKKDQERKEVEVVVSRGKREWEATFDSVQDLIIVTDQSGSITRCNRACLKAFNVNFNDLIGKKVTDVFFGPGSSEQLPTEKKEMKFPVLDGWFDISSNQLVAEGEQQGMIYIARNITETKQATMDLQRQKQYFEAIIQNSPIGIATLSLDHRVVAVNPAFEMLFGFNQQEVLGKDLDTLISPTELIPETSNLTEQVEMGEIVHVYTQRLRKDGSLVDVELFGVPVVLWGRQIGILGIYHDVSELIRAGQMVASEPVPDESMVAPEEAVARKVKPVRKRLIKIETIEGIGPIYAQKLNELGIMTTEDLLMAGATRKGREELVEKTEISDKLILKWINKADLMRVPGIGEEYSDLLEEAGVDTVKELRNRVPNHLYQSMLQINALKRLVRRTPYLSEVEAWVQAAKDLDPIITY
jgi:PAS domain S-box-containing protein